MITYIDGCLSIKDTERLENKLFKSCSELPKSKSAFFTKRKDIINTEVTSIAKEYSEVLFVYNFINDNIIKPTVTPSEVFDYGIKHLDYQNIPFNFNCNESNNYYNLVMDHNQNVHVNFLTVILFLNDCDERTVVFPYLDESFKPKKGHAVCFPSNNAYSNYSQEANDDYKFLKYTIGYNRSFPSL